MVVYKCPRCNYTVYQRCDIKKHFNRKKPCTRVNEFLSVEECREKVLGIKSEKSLWTKERTNFELFIPFPEVSGNR